MGDFGDIDDFNDHAVQGKPIKAYRNGHFENPKILFVQHHWTWDDFLCAASQRLEMVPMASRVFNADGAEIDDIMCMEENDMVFFSTGRSFKAPSSSSHEEGGTHVHEDKMAQVVGGYKVSTLLGRGGFGEVRLGIHQLTNDKVALKFILKSEMGSLGDVERTTTEIQCLTALNHPSIIKLLRVINEPNHVVLVIELLEGGDLFHYLKNAPPGGLPESEGAPLFLQILSGVGFAHNQHICHRDLKLENILLSNKNDISNVKIADFGLSDFYKPGAMMKTSCGSISYLAPEVFRGTSNAGPPLDVWSLGVILFAIVCGRLPFEGLDLHGTNRPRENVIRNRILRCQYKVEDHLSPALVDLITQLLKPDPNERATIPEIFSHPWVRGNTNGSLSSDMALYAARDDQVDEIENEEDLDFSITYSPKATTPVTPGGAPTTPLTDEEKLPFIVQRSPSRIESFPVAGNATNVSAGISGKGRPTRIADMPLHTKQSFSKLDKSPRPSIITTTVPIVSNGTTPKASGSTSPQHGTLKRNPSSLSNGSTRTRQRGTLGSGSLGSEKDKTHAERAPVHAGDSEKLPHAHQKASTRRRSEQVGNESEHGDHSLAHNKASSYGADMTAKKLSSGGLHLPGTE